MCKNTPFTPVNKIEIFLKRKKEKDKLKLCLRFDSIFKIIKNQIVKTQLP